MNPVPNEEDATVYRMVARYRATYTDMVFIQQMEWADGTFYLAFREKTKEEKLVAALNATSNSITDVQVALAEVYEMVLGGN